MKYTTIPTLVMVIGSSIGGSLLAQETVPATPIIPATSTEAAGTVKSQIETAIKDYNKKSAAFMKKVRAEKDRTKQRELFSSRPSSKAVVDLILKSAKEDPKAEGVEQGLVWSLRQTRGPQLKEVSDLLLTHYKDSEALGQLAYMYSRMRTGGEEGLRTIIKKAGSEKVRQGATYYLASTLIKKEESKAEGVALMKKLQEWPQLAQANPKLLEQVKGKLFVLENLAVGCTAPDIVGTDHEGKEFKLSDYKGKVVLLDFWGIW